MIDKLLNNFTKNQVSAVYHSSVICRSVSPNFIELNLCMEMPCLCPSEGHKLCGHKVTETSVTVELWPIERNVSSSASTTAFLGCNFCVTQCKSLEIQTCSIAMRTTLSS